LTVNRTPYRYGRVWKTPKAAPRVVTLSASEGSQPHKTEILRFAQNDIPNTPKDGLFALLGLVVIGSGRSRPSFLKEISNEPS